MHYLTPIIASDIGVRKEKQLLFSKSIRLFVAVFFHAHSSYLVHPITHIFCQRHVLERAEYDSIGDFEFMFILPFCHFA